MPRCVRNFWLTLFVDGKKSVVSTGPRGKDGGFDLRMQIRDQGVVGYAGRIRGRVVGDNLVITYEDGMGVCHNLCVSHRDALKGGH